MLVVTFADVPTVFTDLGTGSAGQDYSFSTSYDEKICPGGFIHMRGTLENTTTREKDGLFNLMISNNNSNNDIL